MKYLKYLGKVLAAIFLLAIWSFIQLTGWFIGILVKLTGYFITGFMVIISVPFMFIYYVIEVMMFEVAYQKKNVAPYNPYKYLVRTTENDKKVIL